MLKDIVWLCRISVKDTNLMSQTYVLYRDCWLAQCMIWGHSSHKHINTYTVTDTVFFPLCPLQGVVHKSIQHTAFHLKELLMFLDIGAVWPLALPCWGSPQSSMWLRWTKRVHFSLMFLPEVSASSNADWNDNTYRRSIQRLIGIPCHSLAQIAVLFMGQKYVIGHCLLTPCK